jgi:hypothetical protein
MAEKKKSFRDQRYEARAQRIAKRQAERKARNGGGTAASLILDVLKENQALDKEHAVTIDKFKDLPLSTTTISYTMANLIDNGVVHQTNDQQGYWFDQQKWDTLSNNFVRGYAMIVLVPLVVGLILVAVAQFILR